MGAGPVGALLALALARLGHRVCIWERRSDPRVSTVELLPERAVHIVLSKRGLDALGLFGITDRLLEIGCPIVARRFEPAADGPDGQRGVAVSRRALSGLLLSAAESTGQVTTHFQTEVTGCDFNRRSVQLRAGTAETTTECRVARLFGADGVRSVIRTSLAGSDSGAPLYHTFGYRELSVEPERLREWRNSDPRTAPPDDVVCVWAKRGSMLRAVPRKDGGLTLTFYSRLADLSVDFFEAYRAVSPWVSDLPSRLTLARPQRMLTRRVARWSVGDWSLLLGDAAHVSIPIEGQGLDLGLEDVACLLQRYERSEAGLAQFGDLEHFADERRQVADALAERSLAIARQLEIDS